MQLIQIFKQNAFTENMLYINSDVRMKQIIER